MRKSEPLYGLVLAGGQSRRMGKDKSTIDYHGKPQVEYLFDLLSGHCSQVFLSTCKDRAQSYSHLSQIHDDLEFEGKGPIAGILSAMKKYPDAAWLIVACDLPFVNSDTLAHLLKKRDGQCIATAFKSRYDGLPEPLCALWEPGHFTRILHLFKDGIHCPRKMLIKLGVCLLELQNPQWLDNVNNPQELSVAVETLKKK